MENNKNEIDLLELLIKIYISLKKYYFIILGAIILSVIITFVKNGKERETYTSSMILSVKPENNYMYAITLKEYYQRFEKNPAEIVTGIISQADDMLANGNINTLAEKMNLNPENLKGLKSLSSYYKYDKNEAHGSLVKINASASDKKVFDKLGEGIVNLINNNDYVKNKTAEDSLMLLNIIKKTDKKINELDSLQSKFLKNGKINDLIIFKENSFFGENVMLTALKEKLANELKNIKKVQQVNDFYTPKPQKQSIKKSLAVNIIIAIIISFIIISVIIFVKKASEYEKNNS